MLGGHLSPRSRSEIEQADVVFGLVSDAIVELWLQEMRADMRSLQPFYAEGKRRTDVAAGAFLSLLNKRLGQHCLLATTAFFRSVVSSRS